MARGAGGGTASRQLLPTGQHHHKHRVQVPDEHREPGGDVGGRAAPHRYDEPGGGARIDSSEPHVIRVRRSLST